MFVPDYANVLVKVVVILGLINRVPAAIPEHNVFCYSAVARILNPRWIWLSGVKNKRRAQVGFGLRPGSRFKMRSFYNFHMWLLNTVILAGKAARQWLLITVSRDAGKRRHFPPDLSQWVKRGRRCLFLHCIIGNCMVYQDRIKTTFSIDFFSIFEINIIVEQ